MSGRSRQQPGPSIEPRVIAVDGRGHELEFIIPAGVRLLDGVGAAVEAAGFASAAVDLEGGGFGPFTYVIPALSTTPDHAAFYSEMRRPAGITPLLSGRMTYGRKSGQRWFHAHGFWRAEGVKTGGHIIPDETMVAEPIRARALALSGVDFIAEPDPETNFHIFGPVPGPARAAAGDIEAIGIRIRGSLPGEGVAIGGDPGRSGLDHRGPVHRRDTGGQLRHRSLRRRGTGGHGGIRGAPGKD